MIPLIFALSVASAQDQPSSLGGDNRSPMAINFRYRSMWVPDTIIDTWYFTTDEGAIQERPSVGANVYGLEYAIETDPEVYTFYIEYMSARLEEGYWDDIEDPADHRDGDWIQPEGLGAVVLGVNYGHELKLTPESDKFWAGFMVGGGLGFGIATGHMNQWKPGQAEISPDRCEQGSTSIVRKDKCEPDDTPGIWPVIPMVDISMSLRLHIMEYGIARLDFGVHDMLYMGTAVGGVF